MSTSKGSMVFLCFCLASVGCEHVHNDPEGFEPGIHDHLVPSPDLATPSALPVTVSFLTKVGDQTARCGQRYGGLGKGASSSMDLSDLRFYVHDLRLVNHDGAEVPLSLTQDQKWQHQNVALLDFEDKTGSCTGTTEQNAVVSGWVPGGAWRWQGLRFRIGVPFALNHADPATAPSPLNLTSMFWSWQSGYKFLRLEAELAGGTGLILHLGSTGCKKDGAGKVTGCDSPNRPEVELVGFDPAQHKVVLDLKTLLAESDLGASKGVECMSGPGNADCAPLFSALGLAYGGASAKIQHVFRAEP